MSETSATPNLTNHADIQGLVFSSYSGFTYGGYCLFRITDRAAFQSWLNRQLGSGAITSAAAKGAATDSALNIAFSASGMELLLGRGWVPDSFEDAFVEGMVEEHRSRLLGDVDANDPKEWLWGNDPDRQRIDGLLMGFADARAEADPRSKLTGSGAEPVTGTIFGHMEPMSPRDGKCLKGKEPFGFEDGISQPALIGSRRHGQMRPREQQLHGIPPGELVLGYPDGSDSLPRTPATAPYTDVHDRLQSHWERDDLRDLGRHGSYLVLRQLEQNVDDFWTYLENAPKAAGETADTLGAKLVGRHRSGRPLVPPDGSHAGPNGFDFSDDARGTHCPLGSHVRRSNPRSFGAEPKEAAAKLKVTNRHRILRRGRIYVDDANVPLGLLFLCLNASIRRQFEFIQATWCNNPFFAGMDREVDPIIGTVRKDAGGVGAIDRFTVQRDGYRRVVTGLKQFVTVKGGAYFFMPGMAALACLADAP